MITVIDENDNMLYRIAGLDEESQEKSGLVSKHFKDCSMMIFDEKPYIRNSAASFYMTSDVILSLANQASFTTDKGNSFS